MPRHRQRHAFTAKKTNAVLADWLDGGARRSEASQGCPTDSAVQCSIKGGEVTEVNRRLTVDEIFTYVLLYSITRLLSSIKAGNVFFSGPASATAHRNTCQTAFLVCYPSGLPDGDHDGNLQPWIR